MDSASRHSGDRPSGPGSGRRHVTQRLHPALTDVLNRLDGTPIGEGFKERALQVSTSALVADPVDHSAALAAYRWLLGRADGAGLPLTDAGYLKPADVKALAEVLPTMRDYPFTISREVDVFPIVDFRDYLKAVGLLRKYKASLRLTKTGREALADANTLWRHVAATVLFSGSDLDMDASVVVLVHMATTPTGIDGNEVAATMSALGWSQYGGTPVRRDDIEPVWSELWTVLGNVGERASKKFGDGRLSDAARIMIHNALFDEVSSESIP